MAHSLTSPSPSIKEKLPSATPSLPFSLPPSPPFIVLLFFLSGALVGTLTPRGILTSNDSGSSELLMETSEDSWKFQDEISDVQFSDSNEKNAGEPVLREGYTSESSEAIVRRRLLISGEDAAGSFMHTLQVDQRKKDELDQTQELSKKTQEYVRQCKENIVTELTSPDNKDWEIYKGYACEATDEELAKFFDYVPRQLCPDDWFFVQKLIFVKNCYALPKRRCLARTPQGTEEPLPRHLALFNQRSLISSNVRWSSYGCDSFECLNMRSKGDCKHCFNMTIEANRWKVKFRGAIPIKDVVEMKRGTLRLGLDAGRGTGSFAAHLSLYNVTVITMAMNIDTQYGGKKVTGLPYMESIAMRGLIPFHLPHMVRLPFFDNTLDLVHCVNTVKFLPLSGFEDLLYEWDRVLRAGGIIWFELFTGPVEEMQIYVQIIELLQYKKLYWNIHPRPERETRGKKHIYLNFVLEKPPRAAPLISTSPPIAAVAAAAISTTTMFT